MATESTTPNLADVLGLLRRRRVPMLIAFTAILLVALALAWLWPATYRSTGTILIEQQEVPTELVRSTISSYADQRIQVIQQQVMTTENLSKIIQKYDLYARRRRYESRELIMKRMTDDVQFKMISADVIDPRSGVPTKATIAFSVGFASSSPEVAARVANELVSLYLEQNLESRKQHTADAADFLGGEAERLSKRIDELQSQIATFKQHHLNDLPELAQLNQTLLGRTDDEVREVETRMRSLDQQITYLDAQLAQLSPSSQVYTATGERVLSPADRLKFLRTEYARLSGIYAPDHPDVLRTRREIEGLEKTTGNISDANDLQRQLEDARTQLAAAREKYSADYPDRQRLERLVGSLQERLDKSRAAPAMAKGNAVEPDNPAYIQIKSQREAAINEKTSLEQKSIALKQQTVEFERRLASAPAVERDYLIMERELENDQTQYREVRQKQLTADSSRNLEAERKGERMTLIEPPLTPTEPASPNRSMILLLGVVLSIAGAVAIAALLNTLDTTVRNRRDLSALLKVPPLAVLPWISTAADLRANVVTRRLSIVAVMALLAAGVALIHFFYRPLDVLWQVAARWVGA
jgi:uncharacterized protein involved in exopolysaccharide biosynthesis